MKTPYEYRATLDEQNARAADLMKPWPKCRECGRDLILQHVRIGFCNAECEAKHRYKNSS